VWLREEPARRVPHPTVLAAFSATGTAVALLLGTISIALHLRAPLPPTPNPVTTESPTLPQFVARAAAAESEPSEPSEPTEAEPESTPVVDDPWVGLGQSMGTPRQGWLTNARRLEEGKGYTLRHPDRLFATDATIAQVLEAIEETRNAIPSVHDLGIGDLSGEFGGLLRGHLSHQSGRDIDLGLYYKTVPPGYPTRFVAATPENLHPRAMWELIEALADTVDQPGGVQWILLDYRVQRLLYHWGERQDIDAERLDRVFQYPDGPGAQTGIVRHFPGHDDHMHIRFGCPPYDNYCRDPSPVESGPRPLSP